MQRIDVRSLFPEAIERFFQVSQAVKSGPLGAPLVALVSLRASQLNGCAFCLDMHDRELRDAGEDPQRLACLPAWRESGLFEPRERAALAWTEAVTRLGAADTSDELYAELEAHFSSEEIAQLTVTVAVMAVWNRLAVSLRRPVPRRKTRD